LPWLLPMGRAALAERVHPTGEAALVLAALQRHGALFARDLADETGLLPSRLEDALSQLAALGLVTADGFTSLRLLTSSKRPSAAARHRRSPRFVAPLPGSGGRWTVFPGRVSDTDEAARVDAWAKQLIRRYGVVFRDLLTRETVTPPWWQLVSVYRRMEARGELRGGRFVAGVAGEQYALPEAVASLRTPRDEEDSWVALSAADPLNLAGIVLPGTRVPATRGNRVLFHNGRLAATLHAGEVEILEKTDDAAREKITRALRLTQLPQLRDEILAELSRNPVRP
jgi:ATP-dependent Lhr-like helicase